MSIASGTGWSAGPVAAHPASRKHEVQHPVYPPEPLPWRISTAMAGWFDTPMILLAGDHAAAEELRAMVPEAKVAIVKEGLGWHTCLSLSAPAARELIRERATAAMREIGQIRPYKVQGPVTIQIEYTTRNSLPIDAAFAPGAEVVDDRTIRYRGRDFLKAWKRYRIR